MAEMKGKHLPLSCY